MAKVTIVIEDDLNGTALVEFTPEPDFDGDAEDLTMAQKVAMEAISTIYKECEIANYDEHRLQ